MPETLQYNNKQMIPTPLNMELHEVRAILNDRRSVRVALEPGDATRYDLLITPQNDPDLRFPGCTENHFIVTRVVGGECESCFVSKHSGMHQWLPVMRNNMWSAEFLNWWWSVLWSAK